MSKTGLKTCHLEEASPEILLRKAMRKVDPMLFQRMDHDNDKYSNLEEFSLLKSSTSAYQPLTVAVASPEAAHIFKNVWNAMNTYTQEVLMRPPMGPSSPSSCIVGPKANTFKTVLPEVQEAIRMASIGMAAAPTQVDGLPEQCRDWVKASTLPLPQFRTDFDKMCRHVGHLRRTGYSHVISSAQLSLVASFPGSIAVRWLLLLATLLGQPTQSATQLVQPAPLTANPAPLLSWHPDSPLQERSFHLGNYDLKIILGHLPALQIIEPTTQRKLLRLDRLVDLHELSALQYNALRWTRQASNIILPLTSDGFRLLPPITDDQHHIEYYLYADPVSEPECQAMALAKQARLPISSAEVHLAKGSIDKNHTIWVQVVQKSMHKHGKFQYQVLLGGEQLLPTAENHRMCRIYQHTGSKSVQIREEEIGSFYSWYQNTGKVGDRYHSYSPYSLEVSYGMDHQCLIMVPPHSHLEVPELYRQRCLLLRNGSSAAVHQKQLLDALSLQEHRLKSLPGLPYESRLQNQDRTMPPLSLSAARLVQSLHDGDSRLVIEPSPQALQPAERPHRLEPEDFRQLMIGTSTYQPQPTPAALLALGSSLLVTAGSFVASSVTQEVVSQSLQRIYDAGKYKFVDPLLLSRALSATDGSAYRSSVTSSHQNASFSWEEEDGILLLKNLRILGMIPDQPVEDLTQLSSGLSVVTAAADTLQQFNKDGLNLLESLALDFVADNRLQVDSTGGALAFVLRSGSIALVSFYLSVVDGSPSLLSHRLHALPAFQGHQVDEVIKLDLPPRFQLSHLAAQTNSSGVQATCAKAIISEDFESSLSKNHPACALTRTKPPMMKIIYNHGQVRVVQTFSPPQHEMSGFLACRSEPARHFRLHSQVNVFAIPGNCAFDVKVDSKLRSLSQAQSISLNQEFCWILAYNVSQYDRPLTKSEELWIALYSTGGAIFLFFLIALSLGFKYKHKLPFFRKKHETITRSYKPYHRPSISYPHAGPRSLDDLTSSDETLASHLTNPRITVGNNPFLTPARLRDQRFQGYQATIRRPSYRPQSVQVDVHQPDQLSPTGNKIEKLEESRL